METIDLYGSTNRMLPVSIVQQILSRNCVRFTIAEPCSLTLVDMEKLVQVSDCHITREIINMGIEITSWNIIQALLHMENSVYFAMSSSILLNVVKKIGTYNIAPYTYLGQVIVTCSKKQNHFS